MSEGLDRDQNIYQVLTPQCLHLLRFCITFQREDGLVKRRLVNRSHVKENLFIEGEKIWKNVSIFHSTAFSPRRQGNSESSYLELPTLEHVSKAFRIEIWFLTHSQGKYDDFLTFQPERPFQFRVKAVLNVMAAQLSYLWSISSSITRGSPAISTGSGRQLQWYLTSYVWDLSHESLTLDQDKSG